MRRLSKVSRSVIQKLDDEGGFEGRQAERKAKRGRYQRNQHDATRTWKRKNAAILKGKAA